MREPNLKIGQLVNIKQCEMWESGKIRIVGKHKYFSQYKVFWIDSDLREAFWCSAYDLAIGIKGNK